jgi:hypothetical protein
VIDVSADAREDADFLLTLDVVLAWERQNGRIPSNRVRAAVENLRRQDRQEELR